MSLEKEAANLFGRGMKAECLRKIEQKMEIMKKNWDEFSLQVRSLKKAFDGMLCSLLRCLWLTATVRMLQERQGRSRRRRYTGRSAGRQLLSSARSGRSPE